MLPFYSVDTREEAETLLGAAVTAGHVTQMGWTFIANELQQEQTIENLNKLGEDFAELDSRASESPAPFEYAPHPEDEE